MPVISRRGACLSRIAVFCRSLRGLERPGNRRSLIHPIPSSPPPTPTPLITTSLRSLAASPITVSARNLSQFASERGESKPILPFCSVRDVEIPECVSELFVVIITYNNCLQVNEYYHCGERSAER